MSISIESRGLSRLQSQINALRLTPYERQHVNRAMGRRIASYSKKRIQTQTDLDGAAFSPRKKPDKGRGVGKKKGKGKMLKGLKSRMKVISSADNSIVTWSGGKVAWKHQHGWSETMTARQLRGRYMEERARKTREVFGETPGMATSGQARALLAVGYRIPRNRSEHGNTPRPSKAWIMDNLTNHQAGKILRLMRYARDGGMKHSWQIRLPKRAFLGATANQQREMLDYLDEQVKGRLSRRS